jgi:hypothetical protein
LKIRAPGFATVNPCRKAVLKTRAVQTLRDCRTPSNCAKRLDCGVFTAAFDLAHEGENRPAISLVTPGRRIFVHHSSHFVAG